MANVSKATKTRMWEKTAKWVVVVEVFMQDIKTMGSKTETYLLTHGPFETQEKAEQWVVESGTTEQDNYNTHDVCYVMQPHVSRIGFKS